VNGEKRTNAKNNDGVLLIRVRFKKKTCMRRSKLENKCRYPQDIAQRGSLKLTHLMYKANLNGDVLGKDVVFLIKQGLIEKRNVGGGRLVYSITHEGLSLLKSWKEFGTITSNN